MPQKIAVLVGSLRKESYSRKVAHALEGLVPAGLTFSYPEIGDLPLYNQDLEENPPAPWVRLRQELGGADAVLFVSPEYNRTIPGALKNAIDVASRPMSAKLLAEKPAGVVSISMGRVGGAFANHHLRAPLAVLGMHVMPTPEAYIGGVQELFDDKGALKDGPGKDQLAGFAEQFSAWVERLGAK